MTIRPLDRDEFHLVEKYFDGYKHDCVSILVAEEDGRIVGMLSTELILRAGPIFVEEKYRRKGVGTMLYQFLNENYDGAYLTFPSNEFIVNLIQKLGVLKEVEHKTFIREAKCQQHS